MTHSCQPVSFAAIASQTPNENHTHTHRQRVSLLPYVGSECENWAGSIDSAAAAAAAAVAYPSSAEC